MNYFVNYLLIRVTFYYIYIIYINIYKQTLTTQREHSDKS